MIRIRNITLSVDERYQISSGTLDNNINSLKSFIAKKYHIPFENIVYFNIIKESIDARKVTQFNITVDLSLNSLNQEKSYVTKYKNFEIHDYINSDVFVSKSDKHHRNIQPIIVGMGPAGIFAALEFLENSTIPIIIERGSCIEERINDVDNFINKNFLNTESNVQFGEGGAGTFSDAKLSTGLNNPLIQKILKTFVKFGAPSEILYASLPHIGTDVIRKVIINIRKYLLSCGVKIYFNTKLIDINAISYKIHSAKFLNTKTNTEIELQCNPIMLCIGHSARDTVSMLYRNGVQMIPKSFAIGLRIEHIREDVNKSRYHQFYNHPILGAASYNLNVRTPDHRGVYTFCMCPGGEVVLASSEENSIVVNGMSYFDRSAVNSNSAILVGISPDDFNDSHPLAGFKFQRRIERLAFELSKNQYKVPVQTVGSFLNKSDNYISNVIPSCKHSFVLSDLKGCLPEFVFNNIKYALPLLANKMSCFSDLGAVLTGVETRSSSPVRIIRDDNFMCTIDGLYGAGEGSGFSGGIMSSALDGIKVANKICEVYNEI